ncbi:glycosyltransferase family 4 protein [Micromonospora sp. NBC_00389]|uniref:glycosyltransferase family 4 protein n=1 Tax=Micromonospora sp. NBC_00389 TaxID=2903586 RepID=UPI002E208618
MRIVHIGTSDVPVLHRFGGALQRRIMEMARLQAAAGHEVVVLTPGEHSGVLDVDGVQVRSLPLRSHRPLRDYEMLIGARRWLNGVPRYDVLHAHGSPVAATALGARFAATVQSVDFFRYRGTSNGAVHRYYRARLDDFDLILAASEFCARHFVGFYPNLGDRTRVLYNGVNTLQFRNDPEAARRARSALNLPSGRLVVYLGRVCEQKGSDLLAPLAAALRRTLPQVTVVAAGPPERFARNGPSELTKVLTGAGVRCLGAVDEKIVAGLLSAADVCVLPTRRDEMFGMAALEAAACGTPVVAADLGGIPEAVGPCGLLFPQGDDRGFIEAVTRLLQDPELAGTLRARAPQHVARFEWSSIVNEATNYYEKVLP